MVSSVFVMLYVQEQTGLLSQRGTGQECGTLLSTIM